ncbi:MAG: hypothetical protein Q9182_004631 [Xanthomendoza sp. 2 TL-2023]
MGQRGGEGGDVQEAYYGALRDRFLELRGVLLLLSSSEVDGDGDGGEVAGRLNAGVSGRGWRAVLLYVRPTMMLMARLHHEAVMAGVAAVERYLTVRVLGTGGTFMGAWAWGLLGRCREVGWMGSEEVGVVRGLGKKARGMVRVMEAGLGGGGEEGGEEGSVTSGEEGGLKDFFPSTEEKSPQRIAVGGATPSSSVQPPSPTAPVIDRDEITTAKTRLLASLPEPIPTSPPQPANPTPTGETTSSGSMITPQARVAATLDMLITIVGEVFGQRDLLEGRMVW